MKKITRQSLANGVSVKWKKQYPNDKDGIQKKLDGLGKIKNPDKVDIIIGNKSWTTPPDCSECGKPDNDFVIEVGEKQDYDSATAWLCKKCTTKLIMLLLD